MPASNVIVFGEDARTMTYEQGLEFIARARRQLDRLPFASPNGNGWRITPDDASAVRRKLDDLEADLRRDLGVI